MRRLTSAFAAAACLVAAVAVPIGPAAAQGGPVGGQGSQFFLNDTFTGTANTVFGYGSNSDTVFFGDWDGNGTDTPMLQRGNTFLIRNSNTAGSAEQTVAYGKPGDTVLAGDWDGNGTDTLAVRRGNLYYIKNSIGSGPADAVLAYGKPTDTVLVGDWDGDGIDTLAVRRGSTYYVKNTIAGGNADTTFAYGRPTDSVLVGDWDGNHTDTLGVRRSSTYYLKNSTTGGAADVVFSYGRATDTVLAGDWNGDGRDTLGVRRVPQPPASFDAGAKIVNTDIKPGTYRATGSGDSCYWERVSGFSGSDADTIANYYGVGHAIVTIAGSDAGFYSEGCGSWIDVAATYPSSPQTTFGTGTYAVGKHIQPGTYQSNGTGSDCYWERLSGFSGTEGDLITNYEGPCQTVVTILPTDVGFYSDGDAGTWTKIG